jgi:hypothetical protein
LLLSLILFFTSLFGPPLWSSDQRSWLQIQRPGFDSRRYQIFWEVVGLELGPFSLARTIEELLERKGSGSGLENREYGRRDPLRWPRGTLYPQKLALTSLASGGRSVGIVRSRTLATEFSLVFFFSLRCLGAHGSVVCRVTMLRAGKRRVLFPMRSFCFLQFT